MVDPMRNEVQPHAAINPAYNTPAILKCIGIFAYNDMDAIVICLSLLAGVRKFSGDPTVHINE